MRSAVIGAEARILWPSHFFMNAAPGLIPVLAIGETANPILRNLRRLPGQEATADRFFYGDFLSHSALFGFGPFHNL